VLGRLAVGKVLLCTAVAYWTVALRRHNRGCVDGVAALVFFQLLLELTCEFSPIFSVSLCSLFGGLASEPGMLASCNCDVLVLVMRF
jgi:hypothetical protein